jgi:hypothetical protein
MKSPLSMRIWFVFMSAVLWLGIYLTGFSSASWLLYVPAAAFFFAGVTGICPSQIAVFKFFGTKKH